LGREQRAASLIAGGLLFGGPMINVTKGYTFDDVLLVPQFSRIASRKDIDLSVDLGKGVKLSVPIVSANMKNVTGQHMAFAIDSLGGLALLHRFHNDNRDYLNLYLNTITKASYCNMKYRGNIGISVGVNDETKDILNLFFSADSPKSKVCTTPRIVCIDIAHGDSSACARMTEYIAKKYPETLLIAGNVATGRAAKRLVNAGADVIKVGIGPGSICSTRIETGNGVPQLTALDDVYSKINGKAKIIADGGIKSAGDCVKALCFSNCVMLGNLLAGTDEAPGDTITIDGLKYKQYAGSSTHKANHVEGVVGIVPYKGPVANVIQKLTEGIRSGLSYQGVDHLADLREAPEFVSISNAGLIESRSHDVIVK
jgi:IMP dehydrogenase